MPKKKRSSQKSPNLEAVDVSNGAHQSAGLPSSWAITKEAYQTVRQNIHVLLKLSLLWWGTSLLLFGSRQHEVYVGISEAARGVAGEATSVAVELGIIVLSVISGSLSASLDDVQQLYAGLLYLVLWLVVIWLIRQSMAGISVKLRDALYNAGAPLLSTLSILALGILQLVPFAFLVGIFATLMQTGVLSNILIQIILGVGLIAAAVLTLYWVVSTLIAAVVVTIPGTYPMAAMRSAAQLVRGSRLPVLVRTLWLGAVYIASVSIAVLVIVLLDKMFGYSLSWLVVTSVQLVMITMFIYSVAYLYVLYRKVIDERRN